MSSEYGLEQTSLLTPSLARHVLNNLDPKLFFTDGYLIINWQPFRPMRENYDLILDHLKPTVFLSKGSNGEYEAISFLTFMKVKNGLRYDFDHYGVQTNRTTHIADNEPSNSSRGILSRNLKIIIAHLLKALIFINQTSKGCIGEIAIDLFAPDQCYLNVNDLKKTLIDDLGLNLSYPDNDLNCSLYSKGFRGFEVSRL